MPSPGELIPLVSFSGRVTDGAGNPAAGATVRIDRDREMVATTLTDATGAYEIGFKYAPGTYDLFAQLGQLGVWRTNVPVAPQTPARFALGRSTGARRSRCTSASPSADSPNETASIANVGPGPMIDASTPAMAGPTMYPVE